MENENRYVFLGFIVGVTQNFIGPDLFCFIGDNLHISSLRQFGYTPESLPKRKGKLGW